MDLRAELLKRTRSLNVWKRGGERAPHKPLLLLLALGRMEGGEARLMSYRDIDEPLKELLEQYGPPRKSQHPEYPFWFLQSDQVWEVPGAEAYRARRGNSNAPRRELLDQDARGGFKAGVHALLEADRKLRHEIARELLSAHFPDSLHEEILASVGIDLDRVSTTRSRRDPRFRTEVLEAYEFQCAVCGLDLKMGPAFFCLEAAHIRWHQASGPDEVSNGLALCVIHHRALDRGAIGVDDDRRILVSAKLAGSAGREDWFLRHQGEHLRPPHSEALLPAPGHILWHRKQVFQGPARGR